jgi:hypothetical protein
VVPAGQTIHWRAPVLLPILRGPVRRRLRIAAVLSLAAASGCGRTHDLEEGVYVLAFTPADVFRDTCGLAAGALPTLQAQLTSFGDDVQLDYVQGDVATRCLEVLLVGQYQYTRQNFFADGTAANPQLETGSQVCQLDWASLHLDAVTVNPDAFDGVMRISYVASSPIACNCEFWFSYRATRCTPPACPQLPPECS